MKTGEKFVIKEKGEINETITDCSKQLNSQATVDEKQQREQKSQIGNLKKDVAKLILFINKPNYFMNVIFSNKQQKMARQIFNQR